MIKKWLQNILFTAGIISLATLIGCSGSSSTTSSDPFSGNASISGSVAINKTDANAVNSTSSTSSSALTLPSIAHLEFNRFAITGLATANTTVMDGGTAKLYKVNTDGTKTDTSKTTSVTNGSYTFSNIKDGNIYIVETVKSGSANDVGKVPVIRQKAFVQVPAGATTIEKVDVSPKTGYIVESIVTKVVKKVGTNIDPTILEAFITAIDEEITTQISKGAIDLEKTEWIDEDEASTLTYQAASEEELAAVEKFTNNDVVAETLTEVDLKTQINTGSSLSQNAARDLMRRVFNVSQSSSDQSVTGNTKGNRIPDFFVNGFADAYINGTTITMQQFVDAYRAALPTAQRVLSVNSASNLLTSWNARVADRLTKLYNFYDTESAATTTQAKKAAKASLKTQLTNTSLNKRIPVFKSVFPATPTSSRWSTANLTGSQVANIPQAVMIFGMVGLFDESGGDPNQQQNTQQTQQQQMNHFVFIEQLGIMTFNSAIQIIESRVRPVRVHVPSNTGPGQEKDALDAEVSIYVPASSTATFDVKLKYINTSGVETTATFSPKQNGYGGDSLKSRFRIEPWSHPGNTSPTIVDDYKSGTVTIQVIDKTNPNNILATSTATIYKFNITDITFSGSKNEYDVDANNNAYPLFSWSEPELGSGVSIPSGHSLAYAIDIGLSVEFDTTGKTQQQISATVASINALLASGQTWDHKQDGTQQNNTHYKYWKTLYSSWEKHRFIQTNSFDSPVALKKLSPINGVHVGYNINVRPVIIKDSTNQVIWEGRNAHHHFRVGSVNWSIPIRGAVSFSSDFTTKLASGSIYRLQNNPAGQWKIGLFLNGYYDNQLNRWVDVFWDQNNNNARQPVTKADGTKLVANLGALSVAQSTSAITLSGFPTINKADTDGNGNPLLKKYADYRFIVWYDQTGTITNQKWGTVTPTTDAIDVKAVTHGGHTWMDTVEEMDHFTHINLRRDDFNVRLDYESENENSTGHQEHISQDILNGVTLNITVF